MWWLFLRHVLYFLIVDSASTGEEEEEEFNKRDDKLQKVKRRGSVFSKLGSYRQKKVEN